MDIGYACICIGDHNRLRSLMLKNASHGRLNEVYSHNLETLISNLNYNIRYNIKLFRISSDIFPLITHDDIEYDWRTIHKEKLFEIRKIISDSGLKVSMHPGQYTVLNSLNDVVAKKAVLEIDHHSEFLSCLSPDLKSPVIIHVSSAAGDKRSAFSIFEKNFSKLSDDSKKRLCIENDERSSSAEDIYKLSCQIQIPAVFDNLHNELNPSFELSDREIIEMFSKTFDGRKQKIHYSQRHHSKRKGAHSITIDHLDFLTYVKQNLRSMPDIMLEVKDKDLSCIKCNNIIYADKSEKYHEWARYKYFVMEKNHNDYRRISGMFARDEFEFSEFYNIINTIIYGKTIGNNSLNAAMHIWGYFKKIAALDEKEKYLAFSNKAKKNKTSTRALKKFLLMLAIKYDIKYLTDSIYFYSDIYE